MAKGGRAKERFRERQLVNRLNAEYTRLKGANPNATAEQIFAMQRTGTTPAEAATTTAQAAEYANATTAPAWAQTAMSDMPATTQPDRSGITPTPAAPQPLQWWQYAQQAQQAKTAQGGGSKARYSLTPTPTPNQNGGVGTTPYGPVAPPGYVAPPNPKAPKSVFGTSTGSSIPFGTNFNISMPTVPQWLNGTNANGGVGNQPYGPVTPAGYVAPPNPTTGTGSTGGPGIVQGRTPNPNTGIPDFPMLASLGEAPATGSGWYSNWRRKKKGGGGGYKQWQPQERPAYEPREPFIPGPGLSNWSIG
jgi:hypothetical protein